MEKIKFDLSQLDDNGLIGPVDGKRTLAYEFCIPDNPDTRQTVIAIDSTIQMSKSPGRIGCSKDKVLCLGESNRKYKKVFRKLSQLDFVERIEQTFFE